MYVALNNTLWALQNSVCICHRIAQVWGARAPLILLKFKYFDSSYIWSNVSRKPSSLESCCEAPLVGLFNLYLWFLFDVYKISHPLAARGSAMWIFYPNFLPSLFYCEIAAVLSLSLSDASAVHAALMVSRCANVNKSMPIQPMQRWAIVYKTNIRLLQRWPLGNGIVLYYTTGNAPYVGQTNQHLAYAESSAGPRQPSCGSFLHVSELSDHF